MRRIIIFFLLFLYATISISQSYIHNSGFEDINIPINPNYEKSYSFLQVWEDDMKEESCHGDDNGFEYDPVYLHSPDWFHTSLRPIEEFVNGDYYPINPNTGFAFSGMGSGEIIQQKFFNSNPLQEGSYILTFYIRLLKNSDLGFGGDFQYSNINLKVFLAKNKIKYKIDNCGYWCSTCTCEDNHIEYCKKTDGISQDIDEYANLTLSLNSYPLGYWHKVTLNISVTQNDYDYIGFELQDNECDAYVLLDDISLEEGCVNGCSGTDDFKNITINEYHSANNPFRVNGLNNISNVSLKISQGAQELWSRSINNPPDIIAWNGRDDSGNEVAAAWYNYELIATNDCGSKTYTGLLTKSNCSPDDTQPSPYFQYNSVSKPFDPCCESDIYLENQMLVQDKTLAGPLLYKGINSVITGPNVYVPSVNNNNVVFEAGNNIYLNPGLYIEQGAQFVARIVPCDFNKEAVQSGPTNILSTNQDADTGIITDKIVQTENSNEIEETETVFTIAPNPFEGNTLIKFSVSKKEQVKLFVSNIYGNLLVMLIDTELDAGDYSVVYESKGMAPGMYYCTLETENSRETISLVLIR